VLAAARWVASAVAISLLLALAWPDGGDGGSGSGGSSPLARYSSPSDAVPAQTIRAYEYGFKPSRLVVLVGHVVSWRADGEEPHLVTPASKQSAWAFAKARSRGSVRHVFDKPGLYPYYCSLHPRMRGTVVVKRRLS
jgi:plastocyanin